MKTAVVGEDEAGVITYNASLVALEADTPDPPALALYGAAWARA